MIAGAAMLRIGRTGDDSGRAPGSSDSRRHRAPAAVPAGDGAQRCRGPCPRSGSLEKWRRLDAKAAHIRRLCAARSERSDPVTKAAPNDVRRCLSATVCSWARRVNRLPPPYGQAVHAGTGASEASASPKDRIAQNARPPWPANATFVPNLIRGYFPQVTPGASTSHKGCSLYPMSPTSFRN